MKSRISQTLVLRPRRSSLIVWTRTRLPPILRERRSWKQAQGRCRGGGAGRSLEQADKRTGTRLCEELASCEWLDLDISSIFQRRVPACGLYLSCLPFQRFAPQWPRPVPAPPEPPVESHRIPPASDRACPARDCAAACGQCLLLPRLPRRGRLSPPPCPSDLHCCSTPATARLFFFYFLRPRLHNLSALPFPSFSPHLS